MADNGIATNTPKTPESRLGSLKSLLQAPASRQIFLLAGIAAAVAIGVAAVLWSRAPNYGLLYAGLEQKDAAAVTQVLQAGNTPYTLSADGNSIFVPADDVAGVRLKLAARACRRAVPSAHDATGRFAVRHERHGRAQPLPATAGERSVQHHCRSAVDARGARASGPAQAFGLHSRQQARPVPRWSSRCIRGVSSTRARWRRSCIWWRPACPASTRARFR